MKMYYDSDCNITLLKKDCCYRLWKKALCAKPKDSGVNTIVGLKASSQRAGKPAMTGLRC